MIKTLQTDFTLRGTGCSFPQFCPLSTCSQIAASPCVPSWQICTIQSLSPPACLGQIGKQQQQQQLISYSTKENCISSHWSVSPVADKEQDGRETKEKDEGRRLAACKTPSLLPLINPETIQEALHCYFCSRAANQA